MQIVRRIVLAVLVIGSLANFGAQAHAGDDIVVTTGKVENFKRFSAALEAADLVGVLKGKGPFTVFAPTDAAFAKLPQGTVETLMRPENRKILAALLMHHVVYGKLVKSDRIANVRSQRKKMADGEMADIEARLRGGVRIDGANVVAADIGASNGVIHGIDTVIVPHNLAAALARNSAAPASSSIR
jgi:uncharacterized surface protein with fasciclin (FAS1) repeats